MMTKLIKLDCIAPNSPNARLLRSPVQSDHQLILNHSQAQRKSKHQPRRRCPGRRRRTAPATPRGGRGRGRAAARSRTTRRPSPAAARGTKSSARTARAPPPPPPPRRCAWSAPARGPRRGWPPPRLLPLPGAGPAAAGQSLRRLRRGRRHRGGLVGGQRARPETSRRFASRPRHYTTTASPPGAREWVRFVLGASAFEK